jgi:hypothetical protein
VKRLVLVGLTFGALNGLAAALTLYTVYRLAPGETFAYFDYAPPENVTFDRYGFPWEYVVVPVVLLVLNAFLLPLALRRRLVHADG